MTLTQNYKFEKFGPRTEMSSIYEIWHSQQIEHANYEYNIRQYLELSLDYWLRMIIDCKTWLTDRTLLTALTPR